MRRPLSRSASASACRRPVVVQARAAVALPAPLTVPVGFAVAGDEQLGHADHHMMPVQMDLQLRDLRVLVTGGSAGIGLATAELLIAEGARVAIAARSPEREAERIGAVPVAADLATADGLQRPRSPRRSQALGGLDALVNNVGVAQIRTLERGRRRRVAGRLGHQRDELRALHPRGAAAPARLRARRHRQRLVDVGQAAQRRACPSTP